MLDLLLAALVEQGLVTAGGRQRTDSTHVISAVRDLNRLELAGESVRACVEALSAVAPDWLAAVIDVAGWSRRYGARIDTWRLPATPAKRTELVAAYGADALLLLRAVSDPQAPAWLRELPAVEVLRVVLLQNYLVTTDATGQEVIRARAPDTDGLPPGRARLSSPYGTDARWAGLQGTQAAWSDLAVAEAFARLDHRRLPVSPPGSTTCRSRSGSATRTFRSRSTCAATTSPRTNAASSSARPAVRPGGARGDGRRHRDPVPASVRGVTVLPQSVPLPAVESRPV